MGRHLMHVHQALGTGGRIDRAPVAEAPAQALMEECSDSTVMNSASIRPSMNDIR